MVADACEEVARNVELFRHAHERLVRIGEQALGGRGKEGVIADLDSAVENSAYGRPSSGDRSPAVQELVPKVRDPQANPARRPRVDRVLELLDLSVGGIQRLQLGVTNVIHETVDELTYGRILLSGWVEPRDVVRRAVDRRFPHRDEESRQRDQVDLLVDDAVLLR